MTTIPQLIFLDTNIYLIGAVDLDSTEGQKLRVFQTFAKIEKK